MVLILSLSKDEDHAPGPPRSPPKRRPLPGISETG